MAKYVDINQDDLRIQFTFSEDLSNYTGVMWMYRKDDGIATASSGTATVSAATGTSLELSILKTMYVCSPVAAFVDSYDFPYTIAILILYF